MDKTFTQDDVNRIVQERLARETRVVHEPRVYGPESPYSWTMDVINASQKFEARSELAHQRLGRYATELGAEMARGSREGRRVERIVRSQLRMFDEARHEERFRQMTGELRSLTTGGGILASASGGGAAAFVSPAFLLDSWAPFRGANRTFADQCHSLPLPAFGMRIYLPYVGSATKAGEQTEGSAVTEAVPSTSLETAQVENVTGQLQITQQLHDRGFTGGGTLDQVINEQIQQQLDQELDKYAINQALANASDIAGAAAYTVKAFYKDLAVARESLSDTAGTRLRPTHIFSTSDQYDFFTRQLDSQERPIVTPQMITGFPANTEADDFDHARPPIWSRFTGTLMPGNLVWMTDENIPAIGTTTQTQILVSAPQVSIILMEDDPVFSVFLETLANELKVVLNLRCYVAVLVRHAAGTAVIQGGAYLTSQV